MVYKAGEIARVALEDLIWPFWRPAHHHIQAVNSVRDETNELGDSSASFKFLGDVSVRFLHKGEKVIRNIHNAR